MTKSKAVTGASRKVAAGKNRSNVKAREEEPEEEWFSLERTPEEDHTLAIHEAGHAVAGLVLG